MDEHAEKITKTDGEEYVSPGSEIPNSNSAPQMMERKRKTLVLVSLMILLFIVMLSFGILGPFFSMTAKGKGVTGLEIGFIFGIFQLTMCLISPVFGVYINKIGAKNMLVFGSMICGLANIAFAFLDYDAYRKSFVALCIILRILCGLGTSLLQTSAYAVTSSLFPDNLGAGLGAISMAGSVGMAIGPSVGGGLYAAGGFKLPFLVLGGIVCVGSFSMIFIIPKIANVESVSGNVLPLLKSPGCLIVYLVAMSTMWGMAGIEPILGVFLSTNFGLSVGVIGAFFVITPVIVAVLSPLLGALIDKTKLYWQTMITGCLVSGVAYLFLGPCPPFEPYPPKSIAGVAVSLAFVGIGIPPIVVSAYPALILLARMQGYDNSLQTNGIVSGFYTSGLALGGFIGPLLGGSLVDEYGFGWTTSISGFLALFLIPILITYVVIKVIRREWPIGPIDNSMESEADDERKPIIALENINE